MAVGLAASWKCEAITCTASIILTPTAMSDESLRALGGNVKTILDSLFI